MSRFGYRFRVTGSAVALAVCLAVFGVNAAAAQTASGNDSALQTAVSNALGHDPVLKNQPVIAATANGVVTLSGSVETQQQRQQAETDAANVSGVSGIENNITVTGQSGQNQAAQAPAPIDEQEQNAPPPPPDEEQQPSSPQAPQSNPQSIPPPPPPDQSGTAQAPYAPQGGEQQPGYNNYPPAQNNYPPPQPLSGPVTIPAGTLLQIRLSEPLDVAKIQDGTVFQATAASDVFEGNVLAIPAWRGVAGNGGSRQKARLSGRQWRTAAADDSGEPGRQQLSGDDRSVVEQRPE